MKNNILKSILSLALIFVASLAFSQIKEERDVSEFTGISLGIEAELYLSQGSPQKLVIEANEGQLGRIETVVRDGRLKIKTNSPNSRFKDVKIWITIPEPDALSISGSGKIMAETAIISGELGLSLSGSGKIKIGELKAKELNTSISGSGDIFLSGTAEEMDIRISGSGDVFAGSLKVVECSIKISGSGSCEVDATGELNVGISGSGKVTYFNNPQVDVVVSGSGKVKRGEK